MVKRSKPLVSVVLPVHNGEKTIARAIESIRRQTYSHWELIIINDGSTDNTLPIVQRMSEARINLYSLAHSGIAKSLNFGIKMSEGELIARMDADDECHPDRLKRQVEYLDKNPEIGVVSSRAEYMGEPVQEGFKHHVDWTNGLLRHNDLYHARFQDAPFAHPSVLFRKSLYFRYGGYNEGEIPEDFELWLRWFQLGVQMAKLPEELITWYDHSDRSSRNATNYSKKRFDQVKARYFHLWYVEQKINRPLWVFGAGRSVKNRIKPLIKLGFSIEKFIDVKQSTDPKRIHYHALPSPVQDGPLILSCVSNRKGKMDIKEFLITRGYREGQDFVMLA
ncbi:MAG: glycosyltransferase [Bacteroidota bacterium]